MSLTRVAPLDAFEKHIGTRRVVGRRVVASVAPRPAARIPRRSPPAAPAAATPPPPSAVSAPAAQAAASAALVGANSDGKITREEFDRAHASGKLKGEDPKGELLPGNAKGAVKEEKQASASQSNVIGAGSKQPAPIAL